MVDVETLVCVNITRDILTFNPFKEQCLECHERSRHTVPTNVKTNIQQNVRFQRT